MRVYSPRFPAQQKKIAETIAESRQKHAFSSAARAVALCDFVAENDGRSVLSMEKARDSFPRAQDGEVHPTNADAFGRASGEATVCDFDARSAQRSASGRVRSTPRDQDRLQRAAARRHTERGRNAA